MAKADVVAAAKAQFVQDQDVASQKYGESVYDGAFAEGVASVPPPDADEQAKIDAAVAQAKADDQVALAAIQQQLTDLGAKELSEEAQVAALQAVVDKIKALLS